MNRTVLAYSTLLISFLIEVSAFGNNFVGSIDLLLIIVCFWVITENDQFNRINLAWTGGLLKDLGSMGTMGMHSLLFCLIALLINHLNKKIYMDNIPTKVFAAFFLIILSNILSGLFFKAFSSGHLSSTIMWQSIIIGIYSTVLLTTLILIKSFRLIWR